jgi:ABC-type bacteriocin/lantibiotic exporter with double-glycine peptidase domain
VKIDFNKMTKAELRAYVVAHPQDKAAFYAFVDRFTSVASPETFTMLQSPAEMAEIDHLIRQKVAQMQTE